MHYYNASPSLLMCKPRLCSISTWTYHTVTEKLALFARMGQLGYKGDPHAFEVHAVSAWRELVDSNCSIKDYAMTRVMKAFDGKSKTTQHKIAKDLNNNDLESLNFFDLIHSYCSDLASVGDHRQQLNQTSSSTDSPSVSTACEFCGKPGHNESNCHNKKAASKTAKERANQKCNHCGKHGHTKGECKSKAKEETLEQGGAAAEADKQQQLALTAPHSDQQQSSQVNSLTLDDPTRVSLSKDSLLSILQALENQQGLNLQ